METRTYRTVNGMIYYTEGDAAVSPKQPEPVGAPTADQEPEGRIPLSGVRDELPTQVDGVGTTFRAPIAVRGEPAPEPAPAPTVPWDRPDSAPMYGRPNEERTTTAEPSGGAFRLPVGQVHESEPVDVAPIPPSPTEVTRIPAGPVPPIDPPPLPLTPQDAGTTVRIPSVMQPDDQTRRVEKEKT